MKLTRVAQVTAEDWDTTPSTPVFQPPRPWSTMPVTGAQHDAWMKEWRDSLVFPPELWSKNGLFMHTLEQAYVDRQFGMWSRQAIDHALFGVKP